MIKHGRYLPPDELGWDLKGPCSDCPFRRDAPVHEGIVAGLVDCVQAMQEHRFAHTCHKTDNEADGPKNHTGMVQHCGGALHFMVRAGCDLQLPLLNAAAAKRIDLSALTARAKADERIFGSVLELLDYYLNMGKGILNRNYRGHWIGDSPQSVRFIPAQAREALSPAAQPPATTLG